MARIIEEIILKVGVDTSGIGSKVGNASDDFGDLEDSVKDYDSAAKDTASTSKGLGIAVTGMAAAAAAATVALGVMIAKNIEMQTETIFMAQALGIGAQRLQDLQNVGRVFGATADDVTQGIKNINESASEAFKDQGGSKFELFKEMNIDLEKFNQLSPDQQFIEFSKALEETDDQGRKTAIRLALMGEEGFKLAVAMEEIAESGGKVVKEIGSIGGDIDSAQVKEFGEQWRLLGLSIDGVTDSIVDSFIPIIQGPLEKIVDVLSRYSKLKTDFDFEGIEKAAQDAQDIEDALATGRGIAGTKEAKQAEKEERARLVKHLADEDRRHERGRRLREFAHKQEVKEEEEKNRKIEAERRKQVERQARADKRVSDRKKRDEESAIKTIKSIGSARRRDRLSQLKERGESFGVGAVEAGSAEAARLAAERQLIDPDRRTQIDQLEAAIQEEELAIQEEQLKTAIQIRDTLRKERNATTIKTKRIN